MTGEVTADGTDVRRAARGTKVILRVLNVTG